MCLGLVLNLMDGQKAVGIFAYACHHQLSTLTFLGCSTNSSIPAFIGPNFGSHRDLDLTPGSAAS